MSFFVFVVLNFFSRISSLFSPFSQYLQMLTKSSFFRPKKLSFKSRKTVKIVNLSHVHKQAVSNSILSIYRAHHHSYGSLFTKHRKRRILKKTPLALFTAKFPLIKHRKKFKQNCFKQKNIGIFDLFTPLSQLRRFFQKIIFVAYFIWFRNEGGFCLIDFQGLLWINIWVS